VKARHLEAPGRSVRLSVHFNTAFVFVHAHHRSSFLIVCTFQALMLASTVLDDTDSISSIDWQNSVSLSGWPNYPYLLL